MPGQACRIRGIIFDMDGTLYVCDAFAATIQAAAEHYIAGLSGVSITSASLLIARTRAELSAESGGVVTLSAVCTELGGNIRDLHDFFERYLHPEKYLTRNEQVVTLMTALAAQFPLYIYTNNNRNLTGRILKLLGLEGLFRHIYTIDDDWKAKPDEVILDLILAEAGLEPPQALFVGDRYDVDLRLPEQRGCPVYLSQSVEQLLRLVEILDHSSGVR